MDHARREYRKLMQAEGFAGFACRIKETDLAVQVDEASFNPRLPAFVEERVLVYRMLLEEYLAADPEFRTTLKPRLAAPGAPPMALAMIRAGNMAGVGPMAAVAGAFAEFVGRELLTKAKQVIVENGGDLFLSVRQKIRIAVYAGNSPLSNRLALELEPQPDGCGVCTSSGTVGPSFSFGRADAAVIISPSAILADAVATATANRIKTPADLQQALEFARSVTGVDGVLVIKDDKLAAWGRLKIVPL
ncbi:MAG TPA: UPF0280 family protein [Firmicutes bacterium]|nr:UPF0280 family protein [Bacillota bacterium]